MRQSAWFSTSTGADPRSVWRRLQMDAHHGPLPALLVGLTILTGIVDAVSILALGRVFVANMTGNLVFAGFALAGASGFAITASLAALAGFIVGARAGGQLIRRFGSDRARLVAYGSTLQLIIVAAALVLAGASGSKLATTSRDMLDATLAVGAGMQNAVVRRLAVPDLTTTVLTMTLTGIAADVRAVRSNAALARRLLAVAAMLTGAVIGAELVVHMGVTAALGTATALLVVISGAAGLSTRAPGAWRAPQPGVAGHNPARAAPSLPNAGRHAHAHTN